jgi:hypothetical protein
VHSRITRVAAALGVLAGALATTSLADEAHPMSQAGLTLTYTHLYSDAQGISHFRDEQISFDGAAGGPGQPPAAKQLSSAPGATLLALKRGAKEDWHTAPRRMYLVALTGMSEVTTGDGTVRRFAPGSILLMDDTTGKGHITRSVGDVDHVALTIPAPAEH